MNLNKISSYFNPDRILDIGANIGQFHKLAKEIFPNSYIFSIEASNECEAFLKQITSNYYIGLLAKDNSEYDFYSRKNTGIGTGDSIYRELTDFYSDENLNIIKKRGIKLDDLFEPDSEFDLIKIDTQGSELDIISGGINLCKKAKAILLEVSILKYNEGAPLHNEVVKFMENIGFEKVLILDESFNNGTHQQDILFINKELRKNLLIGAISGNYSINDVKNWVETSNFTNTERVLLMYNSNLELEKYLEENNVFIIKPSFDFWGQEKTIFTTDTGTMNLASSYDLIHNIRFFHIWKFLQSNFYNKVLITDVRDVYFNENPFSSLDNSKITATSEIITYENEAWNQRHLYENLGLIGAEILLKCQVYNVGVFGGPYNLIKDICADIYLMSIGKPKVGDQTSFNYLIQTKYKNLTRFTTLEDKLAVHLHVVNAGLVSFDLNNIKNYKIIHQHDRIAGFKR